MNKLSKILTVLAIGGAVLSTSAIAFATENQTTTADKSTKSKGRPAVEGKMLKGGDRNKGIQGKDLMKNDIEINLKTLVSAGVITQDESDKILALSKQEADARQAEMDKVKNMTEEERKAYFEASKDLVHEDKQDIFAKAVSSGILTQDKADAANAKLHESVEADNTAKVTEGLSGLVTAGTITQAQADKVQVLLSTLEANNPAKGTDQAAAPKNEKKSPLSSLVDDDTLTHAQLDSVSKVLPMGGGRGHGGHDGKGGPGMTRPAKAAADTTSSTVTQ